MELSFLGGASTVTGSRFLLNTSRAQVLIDCGMFQGSPNETVRNRVPLGMDASELDAILITHAHLDHCGLLPVVVRDGFRGRIYLTSATAELTEIVLLDSGRLQEEFRSRIDALTAQGCGRLLVVFSSGHPRWARRHPPVAIAADAAAAEEYHAALDQAKRAEDEGHVPTSVEPDDEPTLPDAEATLRAQPPAVEADLDEPLYTEADAKLVMPMFEQVRYGAAVQVADGITATFVDAGHILGSAIIHLEVRETEGAAPTTIVFSGDLGRPGTPILRDATPMSGADYVVVESTYGGREHEPAEESVRMLAEVVRATNDAGGVLLIPSFAIGRTQEVVWELDRLIERGEIPQLPLYLDSPMASRASDVYRRHPEFYDEETRALLAGGSSPLDYPDQTITRSADESKAIALAARPYMIVASNGMLTGGRVVSHLRNLIDGAVRQVRCRVRSISGFSAHADESELLDWIGNFTTGRHAGEPGYPRTVFLVHGDPEAQLAIAPKVSALGLEVHVPHWRERVTLD